MGHRINERNSGNWSIESEPKKRKSKKLNQDEQNLVNEILGKVFNCMDYDKQLEAYVDGGNFVLQLSKDQMQKLADIIRNF